MNWFLQRKLDRIGRKADPHRDFQHALQKTILQRISPARPGFSGWKVAVGLLTSFALLFGGTGTYAYASDAVLPDHPLYPVRETIEEVEEALAVTEERAVKVRARHVQKRLQEKQLIEKRQKPLPEERKVQFEKKLEKKKVQLEKRREKLEEKRKKREAIRQLKESRQEQSQRPGLFQEIGR